MSLNMLGKKVGMTQIFNEEGHAIPVTILQVGPCTITQVQNNKIQIGYEYINPQRLSQPSLGYFNKLKIPCFKYLKEYESKSFYLNNLKTGIIYTIKQFKKGHFISVSATSIGKGFSGYQKRHHFSRGPMSHGSKNHRQPGSIGAGTTPGRVFPGKRMAGRMGCSKVTIKNLQIIDVNLKENILIVKGSVPGKKGNLLQIYNQK
uniref:Large ribosomal subunit protein uL3c n=1 Tax=Caloglossa beccarii TaxID=131038 RepID=A0A1Z1M8M6_9FLOR|nr:ribosomal protein L3 [Caloglossa beccarii]ARW62319.1 ribosomal protein L3 [Caloglossa beccarii]